MTAVLAIVGTIMSDGDAVSKKRPRGEEPTDEAVEPQPNTAPTKKAKLKHRGVSYAMYLEQLPSQDHYELSYAHLSPLTHISVTKTDFIITASSEGQLMFWKKEPTGIRFYKEIRSHLSTI